MCVICDGCDVIVCRLRFVLAVAIVCAESATATTTPFEQEHIVSSVG